VSDLHGSWSAGSLASLGPLLSLLVPFVRSISRRYRIQSSAYYCELLKRRREATDLMAASDTEPYPGLRSRLQRLLRDIDRELAAMEWDDEAFRLFIVLAGAELVLFSGAIFAGLWDLRAIIVSKSWQTGIPFFEGIFQYVPTRVGLFMIVVGAAAVAIKRLAPRIEPRVANPFARLAAYLGAFNGLMLGIGFVVFEILVLTDPISPYW
jgi:hypothetical protein